MCTKIIVCKYFYKPYAPKVIKCKTTDVKCYLFSVSFMIFLEITTINEQLVA